MMGTFEDYAEMCIQVNISVFWQAWFNCTYLSVWIHHHVCERLSAGYADGTD
jgi:hypothetical protein